MLVAHDVALDPGSRAVPGDRTTLEAQRGAATAHGITGALDRVERGTARVVNVQARTSCSIASQDFRSREVVADVPP